MKKKLYGFKEVFFLDGKKYDKKADCWNLGVILFFIHFAILLFPCYQKGNILQCKRIQRGSQNFDNLMSSLLKEDPAKRLGA